MFTLISEPCPPFSLKCLDPGSILKNLAIRHGEGAYSVFFDPRNLTENGEFCVVVLILVIAWSACLTTRCDTGERGDYGVTGRGGL